MRTVRTRTNAPRERRRGAALVELAVCLPTLMFVLLMAMEAADMIFLKQTLHIAAYEAARTAIKPDATSSQSLESGRHILDDRRIMDYTIRFTPIDVSQVSPGEMITVTVTAPLKRNTALPSWSLGRDALEAQVKMNKE
jgi:Flp pilus assembly protein TadG